MRSIDQQAPPIGARRFFGAAGLVVFVSAFFVLPLCAALAICTMPCCDHSRSAESVVSADVAACETECAVRVDEASSTIVPSIVPKTGADRSALIATAIAGVADTPPIAPTLDRHTAPARIDTPLHLLNSTLRI